MDNTISFSTQESPESIIDNNLEDDARVLVLEELRTLEKKVADMHARKLMLESQQLSQPVKMKYDKVMDDGEQKITDSISLKTLRLKMKFHELAGMAVTKCTDKETIIEYKTHMEHSREHYAIKIGYKEDKLAVLQAYTPNSVRIQALCERYPLSKSMELTRVIALSCQTYHDIKHQVENLRVYLKEKPVQMFNSRDLSYVDLELKVSQRITNRIYSICVGAHFPLNIPRPERISVDCEDMDASLLQTLKTQFNVLKKFPLDIGFKLAITDDPDTTFCFYNEPEADFQWAVSPAQIKPSSSADLNILVNTTANNTQIYKSLKTKFSTKLERSSVLNKPKIHILNRPHLKSLENTKLMRRSRSRTTKSSKINFSPNDLSAIYLNAPRHRSRNITSPKRDKTVLNQIVTSTPNTAKQNEKQCTSSLPSSKSDAANSLNQLSPEPVVVLTRLPISDDGSIKSIKRINVNERPVKTHSHQLSKPQKRDIFEIFPSEKPAVGIKQVGKHLLENIKPTQRKKSKPVQGPKVKSDQRMPDTLTGNVSGRPARSHSRQLSERLNRKTLETVQNSKAALLKKTVQVNVKNRKAKKDKAVTKSGTNKHTTKLTNTRLKQTEIKIRGKRFI